MSAWYLYWMARFILFKTNFFFMEFNIKQPFKKNTFNDLGFGSKITEAGERLIHKDGSFNIIRTGRKSWTPYQFLLSMSSLRFTLFSLSFFVLINGVFASLFMLIGIEQLNGVPKGNFINDFLYAFFFSVQTFTTVGYGGINPVGISANFIASLCASVGLIAFALITGLFFARFSKPRSHIFFSKKAILTTTEAGHSFQFRIVNSRPHRIIDVEATVVFTWLEPVGKEMKRHYANLELEREKVFLFPLNWTIVHPITEDSPLFGKTLVGIAKLHGEFLVMIKGFDESYNQLIHTNTSYIAKDMETGVKFHPMYTSSADSPTILHLDCIDKLLPNIATPFSNDDTTVK